MANPGERDIHQIEEILGRIGHMLEQLTGLVHRCLESESGGEGPACSEFLIRSDDVTIAATDVDITEDDKILINNATLLGLAKAAQNNDPGACNVIIQYHVRHPQGPDFYGQTVLLGGPGGNEPSVLVTFC
jgi:hypothetical protein